MMPKACLRAYAPDMVRGPETAGWALAAAGSQADVLARVVAVTSLIVAVVSAVLTWYLWRRSGPEIVVLLKDNHGMEWTGRGSIAGVEVVNSGRMPAVIREVKLCWTQSQTKLDRLLIGKWPGPYESTLDSPYGKWPATIEPTGFIVAAFTGRDEAGSRWIGKAWGVAIRGDGRTYISRRITAPSGSHPLLPSSDTGAD
jgi:hypothetical protein